MTPVEVSIGGSAYAWWDLVPAVVGAIIGALAGGVPAYLLAIRSTRRDVEKEIDLKIDTENEKAFRLFLILRDMLNDTAVSKKHIDEMLTRPVQKGDRFPFQRRISAFANTEFRGFVRLDFNDLTIFASDQGLTFLTRLMEAVERYNSILDSLRTYSRLKTEAAEFIMNEGQHEVTDDGTVKSAIPVEKRGHIDLLDARLETVIAPTIQFQNELLDDLLGLAREFNERVSADLGRKLKGPGFNHAELASLKGNIARASSKTAI